jgi:CxxC motif-containing protein (DUF1111 family)
MSLHSFKLGTILRPTSIVVALVACSANAIEADDTSQSDELRSKAAFGEPLPGLNADEKARFLAGQEEFATEEEVDEGLGPVFNDSSCAACHAAGAVGGGGDRIETRFGTITNGRFDPLERLGGSLIQEKGIGEVPGFDFVAEAVPKEATIRAGRRTTPLFGLGLVDAVPDAVFRALASAQKAQTPGTAGVVSVVPNLVTGKESVGKFGWKAQNPTLFQFSADAYVNEMGITSPLFPNEVCPQGDCRSLKFNPVPALNDEGEDVAAFADFMTFLAPPPRGPLGSYDKEGEQRFQAVGCADCHTPTLKTGKNPVAALDEVTFHPYSDFLLHDMGSLGDGIEQNRATGAQMRTAPLWGIRAMNVFLHDGRATSLGDAVLAHEGQGRAARDAFKALPDVQKEKLLAFVRSL